MHMEMAQVGTKQRSADKLAAADSYETIDEAMDRESEV